ncbi:bifunctional lysozyme/C40 family peptidase [Virgibacillus sp. NKC19-3]|uniref:bifunctional lytic transglycosylase/C40 family peptidase n=1 Tax=Virgibacillus saliphilus TaxID=2831674 RepID=UPI001C9B6565|nr:bifunctional lysozyme/C40 family peptidase [Virgibacillus sp. NKC19-3]MBY7141728.1 bifunctional lysozyme/C40 family peptidase [Virgibacillus sp. NKC19-3]
MMFLKAKITLIVGGVGFLLFLGLLTFVAIFISDEDGDFDTSMDMSSSSNLNNTGLSEAVLAHQPTVEKYAQEYDISEHVPILLAIMEVESGGNATDVMQSSESLGLSPNSIGTEKSIEQGTKYLAELFQAAEEKGVDTETVLQAYNYGGGFIDYVADKGNAYSFELAESFAREQANGKRVTYSNPIAIEKNGGYRYQFGNMFYVDLLQPYLTDSSEAPSFGDETFQAVMEEALKYEGFPYVFGGDNPNTSFDCSGLTRWVYQKAGIELPRTAQEQYDATESIPLSEAEPGDLVFFHSTYNTANYVTHVGIFVGDNQMYQAGDPIGYANLTSSYWQEHLIGAGRIKN